MSDVTTTLEAMRSAYETTTAAVLKQLSGHEDRLHSLESRD